MVNAIGEIDIRTLPENLPLFPLSGALLLPHGHLPLKIFEPRYLNMFDDALGNGRLVGMIQPKTNIYDLVPDDAALYPIGCCGRIVSLEEMDTGHLFVALRGICRFHIGKELDIKKDYRSFKVDYSNFLNDNKQSKGSISDREHLIKVVRQYFKIKRIDVDWEAVKQATDETLVTSLAMISPFEAREKQALLEVKAMPERSELLLSLMEMAILSSNDTTNQLQH